MLRLAFSCFFALLLSIAVAGEPAQPVPAPAPAPAEAVTPAAPDAKAPKEAEDFAAAIEKVLADIEKIEDDDLCECIGALTKLGPEAGDAMKRSLAAAGPRGRLVLAKCLLNFKTRTGQDEAVKALLDLSAGAPTPELRIYAANALGQSVMLFGSKPVGEGLDKAAAAEKDPRVLVALHRNRGRLTAAGDAADALMVIMKNHTGRVRKEAALALGELGRATVPEVRQEILSIFRDDPTDLADRALSIYRANWASDPLLTEVLKDVADYADAPEGKLERIKLIRAAVRGMIGSLDPFSEYEDPDEARELGEHLTGEYGGIGAHVNLVDGVFTIVAPIYDGPAYRAGMRSMDRILEVDGIKTTEEPMNKTVSRLKGAPGTRVTVKVFRRGWREPQEMVITRDRISVPSVLAEMLPGDVGYVMLVRFGPTTAQDMTKAIKDLTAGGMKGLVLDLRNNSGGYLNSAVSVSDEFLPAGAGIVSVKGRREGQSQSYKATGRGGAPDLPVAVLINSGSASASEIVAGALRDNKRAVLVGKKSFGKGSVQEQLRLKSDPGAILKLTIAKYYLPGGECIHEKGIVPEIDVAADEEVFAGWKYEELYKVAPKLDALAAELFKKDPALCRALAADDGGDASKYAGLAEKIKELDAHISPEDARPYLRREVRRLAADERGKRFAANLEDDRQLRKAALAVLERMKVAAEDLPEPYKRYAERFTTEEKDRQARATERTGVPEAR